MKRFRFSLGLLLILILALATFNYRLVIYGLEQLSGQLRIIRGAIPVELVLKDPKVDETVKEKLRYTEVVRRYAMDSLGLKNSRNYTTFFDQKGEPVMWVVTGCRPYEMRAKEWWFPVIGNVSYKGFFEDQKALQEVEKVRSQGFETGIYSPSAWSTLGFFTDPILSEMLNRGPGNLAELIIHELTHSTLYLESNVDFNENFATFIGEQGAIQFLRYRYGGKSRELQRYRDMLSDDRLYQNYMIFSANRLDSLYKSFDETSSIDEKEKAKQAMITEIMNGIVQLPFLIPERYQRKFETDRPINNTDFMSYLRYHKDQEMLRMVLQNSFRGDLRKMIETFSNMGEEAIIRYGLNPSQIKKP